MDTEEQIKNMHSLAADSGTFLRNIASRSYSPYSQFAVGCCLLAANHKMYTGCNVENVVNGNSLCAEGTAIVKMVEDGCQ